MAEFRFDGSLKSFFSGFLFILFGIGLIYGSFYVGNHFKSYEENGVRVTGTIVGMEKRRTEKNRTHYAPVIEYQTENGETHKFAANYSSNAQPTIGEEVPVIYMKDAPHDAIVEFAPWLQKLIIYGLLIGGILIIVQISRKMLIG